MHDIGIRDGTSKNSDDDQADVVELLCIALGHVGLDCRTATTGADALRIATALAPQPILLDIELPDVAGYQVASVSVGDPSTAGWLTFLSDMRLCTKRAGSRCRCLPPGGSC
ncbi:MAG: hypothetical protein JNL83_02545 [Myxococcales bacterium]|nr:hypothetical protein [Myxococcales bacterium]